MNHRLKWFLALSAAVHAAALVVWTATLPDAGRTGQVLQLAVMVNAGQTASTPEADPGIRNSQTAASAKPPAPRDRRNAPARRAGSEPPAGVEADAGATRRARDSAPQDMAATTAAAGTSTVAADGPLPGREESDRQLRNGVLELVGQRLSYPVIARRRGWQGVVTLELHIEADGLISGLQVTGTSGYPVLDRAAMEALRLASIPGAAHWLHGRSIDMLIPVEYRLLDS
jgi:protein TonB